MMSSVMCLSKPWSRAPSCIILNRRSRDGHVLYSIPLTSRSTGAYGRVYSRWYVPRSVCSFVNLFGTDIHEWPPMTLCLSKQMKSVRPLVCISSIICNPPSPAPTTRMGSGNVFVGRLKLLMPATYTTLGASSVSLCTLVAVGSFLFRTSEFGSTCARWPSKSLSSSLVVLVLAPSAIASSVPSRTTVMVRSLKLWSCSLRDCSPPLGFSPR
mmetsp:Transcript_70605/g.163199  ORF Transcript_70605/g.163199 Transcript_70605/m.163199 type:complete len:212 (-) Transcript_70605:147-782(-)